MASFETGKEIEKDVFSLVTSVGQRKRKNIRVPMKNRTSDLRIPWSAVLQLICRDIRPV